MILNSVHVYTFFDASATVSYICTEKHSICELLRRIPSLYLAPSIELAFAAHRMHTHTHYRHVERDQVRCFAFRGISVALVGNLVNFAFLNIPSNL